MGAQDLPIGHCWNRIGIGGDRSCVELETVKHCRNCPTYAAAGRGLLERDVPLDYLNEWTAAFAQPQTELQFVGQSTDVRQTAISAIVFRLSQECFALPMSLLQEVTRLAPIHTVPHRQTDGLLGLVNIRGEILLCASLHHLLELAVPRFESDSAQRMLVVGSVDRLWVFLVDEVQHICRFYPSEIKAPPVVVSHAAETYTQGVIDWAGKKVNYLDADLLLHSLDRKLL